MFFRVGSPFYRFMTLVTNLILLNLVWLVACIPVVTAGAATTAMYSVLFKFVNKEDDDVLKPFWRSFRQNFKQATLLWIPHGLIGLALGAELVYLGYKDTGIIWWLVFGALAVIYLMVSSMIYPMLSRYVNTTRAIVFNSINLTFRNFLPMISAAVLSFGPIGILLLDYEFFLYVGLIWTFGGISLLAYLNCIILSKIFKKYEDPEPAEELENL